MSKNHAAIIDEKNIYTWGVDNNTGRLGIGYHYYDYDEKEKSDMYTLDEI